MSNSPAIEIKNLYKRYKLYNAPLDRLKEAFHPLKKTYHRDFYALKKISFMVGRGEVLGIIGKNGSGKSTILQIICGVLTPTSGSVTINGKISSLLELGAGFNPELTGRENVYFKSSILGNSRAETDAQLDKILSFANIGEFIDQPVKTYSSGMFIRLAFAVAVHVQPDILIIDEALSVGDFRFKQKCLRKIRRFQEDGKTILFVSHDTSSVVEFCTRAIWLRDGEIFMDGKPADVSKEYLSFMSFGKTSTPTVSTNKSDSPPLIRYPANEAINQLPWADIFGAYSFGKNNAVIRKIVFCKAKNKERIDTFAGGERVILALEIEVIKDIARPIVGFILADSKGIHILGINNLALHKVMEKFKAGEIRVVEFIFDFPCLAVGKYSFSPAIAEDYGEDNIDQHHWIHDAYLITIDSDDIAARLGYYLVLNKNFDMRVF